MEVFSMVVALLSGVAMFLYGMMLMGDALKLVAGNKLEAFLYKMTNTPLKGVALGAVFNDLLNSFSRIAAHCAGVVVALLKSGEKGDDLHIHDSRVYAGDGREYQEYYAEYRKKYDIAVSESHMRSMEPEEVE